MGKFEYAILMTPGPVKLQAQVLEKLSEPVQADYGKSWASKYNNVLLLIKRLFNTKGEVIITPGSGSCGLDSCISNSLSINDKIIVFSNGFFGERLIEIANQYHLLVRSISKKWGIEIDMVEAEELIRLNLDAKLIAIVHHETSTGMINPIERIGNLANKYNIPTLVDAVSSIGGLPFLMDDWHVDFCVTASQKCLGTIPGLSIIAISPKGLEIIKNNKNPLCGWYNSFLVWMDYQKKWENWHPYPITISTNIILSLETSLCILFNEGLKERNKQYSNQKQLIKEKISIWGIEEFLASNNPLLSVLYTHERVLSSEIIYFLENEIGIKIANGLGELSNKVLRIGHMSPAILNDEINQLTDGLDYFFSKRVRIN